MADGEHRTRVAVELNGLHWANVLDEAFEGATIGIGTPIHDADPTRQEPLYERVPLLGGERPAFADVALDPAMGAVLMAVGHGLAWDEGDLLRQAERALSEYLATGSATPDAARFVAYSYPKLAVQFLAGNQEVALLELFSWRPVPPRRDRPPGEGPSFFDRWSLLRDLPADLLAARRERFNARAQAIDSMPGRDRVPLDRISRSAVTDLFGLRPGAIGRGRGGADDRDDAGTRDGGGTGAGGATGGGTSAGAGTAASQGQLQFSSRGTNHAICYEVQGQSTSVWCVAASVEMLLDFYRYEYSQPRLATELGLGTLANPIDLAPGQEGRVVTVIEDLTSHALNVTMLTDPTWDEFRDEVVANRPVISFVPGHARTVAGYVDTGPLSPELGAFRGLLVYDPWPPDMGVVTRWENVDVQIYTIAFVARLNLA